MRNTRRKNDSNLVIIAGMAVVIAAVIVLALLDGKNDRLLVDGSCATVVTPAGGTVQGAVEEAAKMLQIGEVKNLVQAAQRANISTLYPGTPETVCFNPEGDMVSSVNGDRMTR